LTKANTKIPTEITVREINITHCILEVLVKNGPITAYGSIAIIKKWVNSGMKESPGKIAAFIDKATEAVSKDFY